jgi:hypothetical protein
LTWQGLNSNPGCFCFSLSLVIDKLSTFGTGLGTATIHMQHLDLAPSDGGVHPPRAVAASRKQEPKEHRAMHGYQVRRKLNTTGRAVEQEQPTGLML